MIIPYLKEILKVLIASPFWFLAIHAYVPWERWVTCDNSKVELVPLPDEVCIPLVNGSTSYGNNNCRNAKTSILHVT